MTWKTVPLGRVAWFNQPADSVTEPATFLGMADLSEDGTTSKGTPVLPGKIKPGYTPFRDRDILVAKITPCFENGKIGQAVLPTKLGWGSTEFHVVRPDPEVVHDRYLLHYLRSPEVRARGTMRMTGSAGQRRVPLSFLSSLAVPLPPLPEQHRIAAILDEADTLRARSHSAYQLLDEIADAAVAEAMISARGSAPLSKLGVSLASGLSVSDGGLDSHPRNRILKVSAVSRGVFDPAELKPMPASYEPPAAHRVRRGDLLMTRASGSPDLIARSTFVPAVPDDVFLPDKIWRVVLAGDSPLTLPLIDGLTRQQTFRSYVAHASSGASGVRNISQAKVLAYVTPIPTTAAMARLADNLAAVSHAREAENRRTAELDALFASLQHRAFRAEL